ncbi:MAG: hypothetical protein ABIP13_07510, partial [Tepidiformaceae bacterium]
AASDVDLDIHKLAVKPDYGATQDFRKHAGIVSPTLPASQTQPAGRRHGDLGGVLPGVMPCMKRCINSGFSQFQGAFEVSWIQFSNSEEASAVIRPSATFESTSLLATTKSSPQLFRTSEYFDPNSSARSDGPKKPRLAMQASQRRTAAA